MSASKELLVAIEAAKTAGKYLLQQKDNVIIEKTKSNWKDLQTKNDLQSEKIICDIIRKKFPNHSFITEETKDSNKLGEKTWVIDPIDGTTNYFSGLPIFAISICLVEEKSPILGVVYAPALGEIFWAEKGKGATINNSKKFPEKPNNLKESTIAFGLNYFRDKELIYWLNKYAKVMNLSRDARRMGSASIDLCWTAIGRFGAYMESSLKPWDIAAGMCIIKETGGIITNEEGNEIDLFRKENEKYKCEPILAATNRTIHEEIKTALKK